MAQDTYASSYDGGFARATENNLRLHRLTASDQIAALGRSVEAIVETAERLPEADHNGTGYGDVPNLIARLRRQIAALEALTVAPALTHSKAA